MNASKITNWVLSASLIAFTACNEEYIAPVVYTPDATWAVGQDISNDGPYAMFDRCAVIGITNRLRTFVRGTDGSLVDDEATINSGTIYNDFYYGPNLSNQTLLGSTQESLQWTIPYLYTYEHSAYYPVGTQLWQMDYATMDLYFQNLQLDYPYASDYAYTDFDAGTFSCFYYYNVMVYNGDYTGNYPGGRVAAPEGIEVRSIKKRNGSPIVDKNGTAPKVAVAKYDLIEDAITTAKASGATLPFANRAQFLSFLKATKGRGLNASEKTALSSVSKVVVKNRKAVGVLAKKYDGKIEKMVLSPEFATLPAGLKTSLNNMYNFSKRVK